MTITLGVVVKKALLILLVVVIVLTGIPILMGAPGMAMCPECGPATLAGATCLLAFVAAALAMVIALLSQRARSRSRSMQPLLLAFLLERPPRLT